MTSLKTLLAAALVATSATVAFASDNGDGARQLDGIRNVQQNVAATMTEGRNAAVTNEYTYGDASAQRPMPQTIRTYEGRNSASWATQDQGIEYRGSAN